jgi:molecular chaperone GrpE
MSENKDIKNKNNNSENVENVEDVTFEGEEKKEHKDKGKGKSSTSKKRGRSKSEKEIEKLKEQIEELNDKYLRLYSEFDNYRKRTAKERIELQKSASKDLIVALLPVLDDFERAIKAFEEHNLSDEAKKGIELIYNKLMATLRQRGLEPMDAKGKDFDTDFHEAITEIPAPGDEMKGKVVDVIQRGYLLNGKVLRYAKVVVGK